MSVRTSSEDEVPVTGNSGWSGATASIATDAFTLRPSRHPWATCASRRPPVRASRTPAGSTEETPWRGTSSGRRDPPMRTFARRHAFTVASQPSRSMDESVSKNQIARAVQNPFERLDPRAAHCLEEEAEHRSAVHHGPFETEAEPLRSRDLGEPAVMVDDGTFVRRDDVLPAGEGREDVLQRDLPRCDPERRDLDHDVGADAADRLDGVVSHRTSARLDGTARLPGPHRLAEIDPARALDAPVV